MPAGNTRSEIWYNFNVTIQWYNFNGTVNVNGTISVYTDKVNGTISVYYLLQILLKGRFRVCSKFFIFRDQILKAHFQV